MYCLPTTWKSISCKNLVFWRLVPLSDVPNPTNDQLFCLCQNCRSIRWFGQHSQRQRNKIQQRRSNVSLLYSLHSGILLGDNTTGSWLPHRYGDKPRIELKTGVNFGHFLLLICSLKKSWRRKLMWNYRKKSTSSTNKICFIRMYWRRAGCTKGGYRYPLDSDFFDCKKA